MKKLREQIIYDEDKILFDEAVACFDANLYRSAYIIAWLSIVESLKRRIKFFANSGNTNADKIYNQIIQKEQKAESVDKLVVIESKNIGIIATNDLPKFDFFYSNRCIYAHPYELSPKDTDVVYILEKSVEILFSKENYFGKEYIENVIENYLSQRHFLEHSSSKIKEYADEVLIKINPSLYPYFFKTLFFKLSNNYEENESSWLSLRFRVFIIRILENNITSINEESIWGLRERSSKWPEICIYGFISVSIWKVISEDLKGILFRFVEKGNLKSKFRVCNMLYLLRNSVELSNYQNDIFLKLAETLDLTYSFQFYNQEEKISFLLEKLNNTNWKKQNKGIEVFKKNFDPVIKDLLNEENGNEIGIGLLNCLISNNFTAYNIHDFLKENWLYSKYIVQGFILGVFTKTGSNKIKQYKLFTKVDELVESFDEDIVNTTIHKIKGILDESDFPFSTEETLNEFDEISGHSASENTKRLFKELRPYFKISNKDDSESPF